MSGNCCQCTTCESIRFQHRQLWWPQTCNISIHSWCFMWLLGVSPSSKGPVRCHGTNPLISLNEHQRDNYLEWDHFAISDRCQWQTDNCNKKERTSPQNCGGGIWIGSSKIRLLASFIVSYTNASWQIQIWAFNVYFKSHFNRYNNKDSLTLATNVHLRLIASMTGTQWTSIPGASRFYGEHPVTWQWTRHLISSTR